MKESPFLRRDMNQGRIEEKWADILKVLRRLFGDGVAGEVAGRLGECPDLDVLNRLFDLALDCAAIEEFRNALA